MIKTVVNFFFVFSIMASMSCASSGGTSSSGGSSRSGDHYEDLSRYRPEYTVESEEKIIETTAEEEEVSFTGEPEYDITDEVNALLDSINVLKKAINYVDGYTVQVYTGINREQANEARATVYNTLPDSKPAILYDQPNFKVKVGKFYTRREAQKTFADLKRVFPAAIIIPERIPITE